MGMTILDSVEETKYKLPFKYKITNFLGLTNIGFNKRGFLRKQYKKSDSSEVGSLNKLGIINYIISSIREQLPSIGNKLTQYVSWYRVNLQSSFSERYYLRVKINLDKLCEHNDDVINYLNNAFSISLEDDKRSKLISYQIYYNIFGKPIYSNPRLTEEELSEYEIYDIVSLTGLNEYIANYYGSNKEVTMRLLKCYDELDESKIKSFI